MTTLLDRIGGPDAVTAAVEVFYKKVLADEQLTPFFADSNMDQQRLRQAKFLTSALAGTAKNADTYMRNAHKPYVDKMGLSETHFGLVATHLSETLSELGVDTDTAGEVMAAVASLQDAVLNRDVAAAA